MHRALVFALGAMLLIGCRADSNCAGAAEPYLDQFGEFKLRALDLLELRTDIERRRKLAKALAGDEESLPASLKPTLERMREQNVTFTDAELAEGEATFWQMLDLAFSKTEDLLQAEISFIESDESTTVFRYPRGREVPAGARWKGLRQQRTFCAFADCLVEDGSEPCLLVQFRSRSYPGSAGLTVGFRRTP